MTRPLRIEYPGSLHHLYNRGNERRRIFLDDGDRIRFLSLLGEAVEQFRWILFAHTLMPNHIHLLVELTEPTLSRGMQWLEQCYTQSFNRKYERTGHLLQGRFKSPLIEKESYFLEVLRYVVLNPVRAGMVTDPADYRWSSYRATAGLEAAPGWLAVNDVLLQFGDEVATAQARYRRFVQDGIGSERTPWNDLIGQNYLGSESWIQKMRGQVEREPRDAEFPRAQRLVGRPFMADIVASVARTFSVDEESVRHGKRTLPRMLAAWIGRHEGMLTFPAIAAGLRLRNPGNVSAMIQLCDAQLREEPALQEALERSLANLRPVARNSETKT